MMQFIIDKFERKRTPSFRKLFYLRTLNKESRTEVRVRVHTQLRPVNIYCNIPGGRRPYRQPTYTKPLDVSSRGLSRKPATHRH